MSNEGGITSFVEVMSRPSKLQSESAVIIVLSALINVESAVMQRLFGRNLSGTISSI